MVGDLIDISSRLDAHRLELLREPVDVVALVRDASERMSLATSGRRFEVCAGDDLPSAEADPHLIAQAIENLLTNAIQYGRPGTPVVVHVACDEGEIVVAVTNEGDPIPKDELSRLFQRFRRTPSARLEGIEGAGLGLYVTRALVEAHGGHVSVESSPAGVTTFRFTLPVASTTADRGVTPSGR
jgi:signal transduction histidine kinase